MAKLQATFRASELYAVELALAAYAKSMGVKVEDLNAELWTTGYQAGLIGVPQLVMSVIGGVADQGCDELIAVRRV